MAGKQIDIPPKGLNTTYGAVFGYPAANEAITYPPGWAHKAGLELIGITGVDEFMIIGVGKTMPVIKYNDGLVVGYFNSKGEPVWFPASEYQQNYGLSVGSFLDAKNCKNIAVENIAIDGNNTPISAGGKTFYNGGWDLELIQKGATGTSFLNTQNVTLKKLDIHHMTLDAVLFQDFYKDTLAYKNQPLSNLYISDIKCDYNRRQGFSWCGGRKPTVMNSTFNHTGTTTSGIAGGNPAAGLDIEPEADGISLLLCVDGTFTNCEFINNKGCGLVNDGNTSIINKGKNVEIISMSGMIFKGSKDQKKPYTFNLQGNTILSQANSNGLQLPQFVIGRSNTGNLNLGHLNFIIGAQSCLFGYWDQTIDIGKNATFINNGQLAMLSGNINLDGKFKLEDGSHTAFFNPVNFNNSAEPEAELSYKNGSQFGVKEAWIKSLDGLGKGQHISNMKFSNKIKVSKLN